MKFKLYLELGTRVEDERVLNLFRFPVDTSFAPGAHWSSVWWSHGRTRKMHSKVREDILSRLARDGFNELTLKCKTGPTGPGSRQRFIDAWFPYVGLSPMNILWAPVPHDKLKTNSEDRKRRNFAMQAQALPGGYTKPFPTVVEYMLEAETPGDVSDCELQKISADLIRSAVPPGMKDCEVFGYGCIDGKCRCLGMTRGVGARGGKVDELGEKFENIYPILIGPRASCEGLAEALGSVEKWPLFPADANSTYIMNVPEKLVVPPFPRKPDVLAPCAANREVRRWLA